MATTWNPKIPRRANGLNKDCNCTKGQGLAFGSVAPTQSVSGEAITAGVVTLLAGAAAWFGVRQLTKR